MKLLIAVVFLSAVQTAPSAPPQAVRRADRASQGATSNGTLNKNLPALSTPDVKAPPSEPKEDSSHAPPTDDSQKSITIAKFPTVSVSRNWADWILWIFNGLLVAAGFLGIRVAYKTLKTIEAQTKATQDSAKATRDSVRALIDSERPWLFIPFHEIEPDITDPVLIERLPGEYRVSSCTVRTKNFGKSPSRILEYKLRMVLCEDKSAPNASSYESEGAMKDDYTIPPGETVPIPITFGGDGRVTPQEKEAIEITRTRSVWFCGYVKYVDTFGRESSPVYETRFCHKWVNDIHLVPKPRWAVDGPIEFNKAT